MSRISDIVTQIRTAVYGRDVRTNIADGIEICYSNVQEGKTIAENAAEQAEGRITTAIDNANTAATNANTAATNANNAAEHAEEVIEQAVLKTDIVNDLNQTAAGKVLDARQGKVLDTKLRDQIDDLRSDVKNAITETDLMAYSHTDDSKLLVVNSNPAYFVNNPYQTTYGMIYTTVSNVYKKIKISNFPEAMTTYGYGFLDSNGNVLSYGPMSAGENIFNVPNNAVQFAVSIKKSSYASVSIVSITDWVNKDVKIRNVIAKTDIKSESYTDDSKLVVVNDGPPYFINNQYSATYGAIYVPLSEEWHRIIIEDYPENMVSFGYAFLNESNSIISGAAPKKGINEIDVPNGAKKMVLCIKKTSYESVVIEWDTDWTKKNARIKTIMSSTNLMLDSYTDDSKLLVVDSNPAYFVNNPYQATYGGIRVTISDVYDKIIITDFPEAMSTYGYGFLDSNGNVLSYGAPSEGTNLLNVPKGAVQLFISIKKSAYNTVHVEWNTDWSRRLRAIEESLDGGRIKEDVIIIGDSWSDTDPTHTVYTKWPVYFEKWYSCNLHNYAKNGSRITGADDYALNGTHGGQIATAISDLTFDHNNVSLVIIEGGINDYNHDVTASNVISAIESHSIRIHTAFPNAKIIVVLNHSLYTTRKQWDYMQTIKNEVRRNLGIPSYTSFGWLNSTDYIDDKVHPDDNGYRPFAANVLSVCFGGSPCFVANKKTSTNTVSGTTIATTITESFDNDSVTRKIELDISDASQSGSLNLVFDSNSKFITNMPFSVILNSDVSDLDITSIHHGIARGVSSESDQWSNSFAVDIGYGNYDGKYIGEVITF